MPYLYVVRCDLSIGSQARYFRFPPQHLAEGSAEEGDCRHKPQNGEIGKSIIYFHVVEIWRMFVDKVFNLWSFQSCQLY